MQFVQKVEWIDEVKECLQSKVFWLEVSCSVFEQDFDIQVFIFMGMFEGVLCQLFRQVLVKDFKCICFVVCGFELQKVGVLLSKLCYLFFDLYNDDVIVEVDLNVF